jgi:hypothetical protein
MLRARLTNGKMVLGLDAGNVDRLMEGKPIVVDFSELGGSDQVMIMYGPTLQHVLAQLEQATGQSLGVVPPKEDRH